MAMAMADWLGYAVAGLIVSGAIGLLVWSLRRSAKGGGCGSACSSCAFFQNGECGNGASEKAES